MRVTADDPPPQIRRARHRRRLWLVAFSLFLLASLFAVLIVGLNMLGENPAMHFDDVARRAQADAVWEYRADPFPPELRKLLPAGAEGEPLDRDLARLALAAHCAGQVFVYRRAPGTEKPGWVLVHSVRRRQRVAQEGLARTIGALSGAGPESSIATLVDKRRVLVAAHEDLAEEFAALLDAGEPPRPATRADLDRRLPPKGPWLRFKGPWAMLPGGVRDRLRERMGNVALRAESDEWAVTAEWSGAGASSRLRLVATTRGFADPAEAHAWLDGQLGDGADWTFNAGRAEWDLADFPLFAGPVVEPAP